MDNQNMTEMSLQDQQNVRGGDWIDTAFMMAEGVLVFLGMS